MSQLKGNPSTLPPNMTADTKVILFDGVCKLCSVWSQFIIEYDKQHIFTLASVQSPEGQSILKFYNLPTDSFDTMLYVHGNVAYERSDAFVNVIKQLGLPWKTLAIIGFLPKKLRNWAYDRIAQNRYTLFGKFDQCLLPSADHNKRFLSAD
ncbi:thiol-disulfide oxidoreductase [Gammaproteobacteria bacterium 45_16_T64]|nr:thiol-disulfide oxidoreductase [Gammaproteobacteria bacterium 45_16_T64]